MLCLSRAVLRAASAAIILLTFGCTESKVAQCDRIIQTANRFVNQATQLTDNGQTNEPQAILQAADAMDKAAEEMQALQISDEPLEEYRNGFVNMYQDISKATRAYVQAYEKKDRPGAEAALSSLQRATQPEPELVKGVNEYCMGKK
ncbi:hypothetical protein [Oscillatoria sp. FACHB-1406]|uniref:hypothetical protein n=1 Tax=Oscillatoria sp. FACHB-1406 TaxID=2692846 RepID=UPI001683B03E|nr:hypothetical protein [Oscillatoria sp. FACHB-1406]MBD2580205.1 hypothetical protein [Oscillatoria sp. FACHB-1406]